MTQDNNSSNIVTYGIIGVGAMGMEHIRNILHIDHAAITCIADNYPQSIESCLTQLRIEHPHAVSKIRPFKNAVNLFKSHLCQIVVIATPNFTHYQILKQAYAHADPNMHILVEKPLCTTIQDCREIIASAAGRPGITYVGLEYCYMPPVARVIAHANDGLVGPPKMVAIREHRFPFLSKVRNWNRFNRNSGGTFVEKCCHFFDLFNRILKPQVPETLYASGAQDVNHLDELYHGQSADVFDNGYVIVQYSGGSRACLDLCMFAESSHSQEEVCIVGPKGKLEAFLPQLQVRIGIRGNHSCANVLIETVDDHRIKYQGHHYGSSFLEHLDILEHIRAPYCHNSNHSSTAGLHQGLLSVAMGIAAHISIEEKRSVNMDQLLTKDEIACFSTPR